MIGKASGGRPSGGDLRVDRNPFGQPLLGLTSVVLGGSFFEDGCIKFPNDQVGDA